MSNTYNLFDGMTKGVRLFVESTVKSSILDPYDLGRKWAIDRLKAEYPNLLAGFMGDNQLFLIFKDGEHKTKTAYVCDVPQVQQNRYRQSHKFDLRKEQTSESKHLDHPVLRRTHFKKSIDELNQDQDPDFQ